MLEIREVKYIKNPSFGDMRRWVNIEFSCSCGKSVTISTSDWKEKLQAEDGRKKIVFKCKECYCELEVHKQRFRWKNDKLYPFERAV